MTHDPFLDRATASFNQRLDDAGESYITDNGVFVPSEANPNIKITVTLPDDPAQALLQNDNIYSTPDDSIFRDTCYICVDPEFAAMGLPLCKACPECKTGHIAADDTVCDRCDYDAYDAYMRSRDEHADD